MILAELNRILSFKALKAKHWIIIFLGFTLIHLPVIMHDKGDTNAYILLAESLCKGQLSLSPKDMPYVKGTDVLNTGDLILFHGKYYLPYPPAPALLMIPFILMGIVVNSILIAVLLTCLNLVLLNKILKRLHIEERLIPWLMYAFFFGTSYWYILLSAYFVYGFAEVLSVTGILLLVNELLGKKRGGIMGLYLGIAFLSRQFTIFISLFVVGYLIYEYLIISDKSKESRKEFWRKFLSFSFSLGACVGLYFVYNYARFGNPLETGYQYILFLGILKDRVDEYGVFSSHYVLYNLYNYLIKGFNIEFTGTNLLQIADMDPFGTSLFIASPFLVACFRTGWNKFLRISAWVTIGIIFTGLLFYHNNGKNQINASRFTMDFLPILFILTALGAKNIPGWLFKGTVVFAIATNIIALIIHGMYHTLN